MDKFIKIIELHFSNKCTGNCRICSKAHGGDKEPFVTQEVLDRTIENLQDVNCDVIQTGGDGDSFLNSLYLPTLKRIKTNINGSYLCLYTNALMLTPERTDLIIKDRLLDEIHIRIDSIRPDVYNWSTGLPFDKVMNNIKYFMSKNVHIKFGIIYFPLYKYAETCRTELFKEPICFNGYKDKNLKDEWHGVQKFFLTFPHKRKPEFMYSGICLWGERENAVSRTGGVCTRLPENDGAFDNLVLIYPNGDVGLCYDKETEVFTNSGWKLFSDISGEEQVLTRKSDGDIEWSGILKKQKFWYEGKMHYLDQRGANFCVTPDHRFCLESDAEYTSKFNRHTPKSEDGYIWKAIKDFSIANYYIPKIFNWEGDLQLSNKYSKQFLSLLGWYIAEGCCYINAGVKTIIIYQDKKSKYFYEIKRIIELCGYKAYKDTRAWRIKNDELFDYLEPLGKSYEKYIPYEIKQLSPILLKVILASLIHGDGWKVKNTENVRYTSTSKRLIDDIQEISYKCGYFAEISYKKAREYNIKGKTGNSREAWMLYISKQKNKTSGSGWRVSVRAIVVENRIELIDYTDFVYDVTAEKNHTLWVRRNGKCLWSGNCAYDDNQDTFILGNLKDKSLWDCWNDGTRLKFIKDIRAGKYEGKYPCTDPAACYFYNAQEKDR